jgi:hypothetical protein
MNRFRASFAALGLALSACAGGEFLVNGVPNPQTADPQITVTLAKRIPEGDSLVMTVTNVSSLPVFFTRCGPGPTVFVEQFVSGAWTGAVQNFLCVQIPGETGPVQLAAGQALSVSRVLSEPGHFRFAIVAGDDAALTGSRVITSNAFDVP